MPDLGKARARLVQAAGGAAGMRAATGLYGPDVRAVEGPGCEPAHLFLDFFCLCRGLFFLEMG